MALSSNRGVPLNALEINPRQKVHGVIVRGVSAEAIVVRAPAIEFVVDRVLKGELDVLPRQIVKFHHPSTAVGIVVRAAGDRSATGVVEPGIGAAGRCKVTKRSTVFAPK